jgi:hypothetical protein
MQHQTPISPTHDSYYPCQCHGSVFSHASQEAQMSPPSSICQSPHTISHKREIVAQTIPSDNSSDCNNSDSLQPAHLTSSHFSRPCLWHFRPMRGRGMPRRHICSESVTRQTGKPQEAAVRVPFSCKRLEIDSAVQCSVNNSAFLLTVGA